MPHCDDVIPLKTKPPLFYRVSGQSNPVGYYAYLGNIGIYGPRCFFYLVFLISKMIKGYN